MREFYCQTISKNSVFSVTTNKKWDYDKSITSVNTKYIVTIQQHVWNFNVYKQTNWGTQNTAECRVSE